MDAGTELHDGEVVEVGCCFEADLEACEEECGARFVDEVFRVAFGFDPRGGSYGDGVAEVSVDLVAEFGWQEEQGGCALKRV